MALLAMVATVMLSLKQQRKCNYEAEVFVCVSLHIQHGRKLDGSSVLSLLCGVAYNKLLLYQHSPKVYNIMHNV